MEEADGFLPLCVFAFYLCKVNYDYTAHCLNFNSEFLFNKCLQSASI